MHIQEGRQSGSNPGALNSKTLCDGASLFNKPIHLFLGDFISSTKDLFLNAYKSSCLREH